MPANHRTQAGYAPLRVADLIARMKAERDANRTQPQWPTAADFACACLRHFSLTRSLLLGRLS